MDIPGRARVTRALSVDGFMRTARHKTAPEINVTEVKMDESLYFIHQIKNSTTVKTGEYEALTRIFTGQKMYVDTRDISLAPHLMLDGVWEESFTRILRRYLKEDTIFFDVGANFGYYGLVAGATIGNEGGIHFFEPNPLLAGYIRKTIAINGLDKRAHLVREAVGNSNEKITLTIPGDYFGSASVAINAQDIATYVDRDELKSVKVPQTTLDAYVQKNKIKHVDVIKIDVEGFEESVYAGMKGVINDNPNVIVFLEFTAGSYKDPAAFFSHIRSDFKNTYLCADSLQAITSMDDLTPTLKADGFAMIAFSNQDL